MTDRHRSASIASPSASDCLGRTCLKWGADGELTTFELSLVLERLALAAVPLSGVNPEEQPRRSRCWRFTTQIPSEQWVGRSVTLV